jgi:pimeloyl-ACP methyl ester carboxylesterase
MTKLIMSIDRIEVRVVSGDRRRGRRRDKVPTLILWGAQDRLVPPAHAHAYAASLPDSRAVVVSAAGHYPYLETPDCLAQEVGTATQNRESFAASEGDS